MVKKGINSDEKDFELFVKVSEELDGLSLNKLFHKILFFFINNYDPIKEKNLK
ncbi:MAG: hypothetical protein OEL81_06360 [Nitrosopumilus sp.]|nr:hypothetical protein [Nitrosopumilus sp.]